MMNTRDNKLNSLDRPFQEPTITNYNTKLMSFPHSYDRNAIYYNIIDIDNNNHHQYANHIWAGRRAAQVKTACLVTWQQVRRHLANAERDSQG